jgi:aquaporin Z
MNSMLTKRRIAAVAAEFLGTGVLAYVVLTVSRSQIGLPYFIALAAGFSVILLGLGLNRDVQLNPALTLGLWTGRRNGFIKTLIFVAAQVLGGFVAYELFKYFSRGPIQPLPSTFDTHVMIAEAFGTFLFAFLAAGVAYQRQHWLVRTVTSGGALSLGILVASSASAALINPAVAVAANAWNWSYFIGPLLGAIAGVNLYGVLFATQDKLVTTEAETATTVASPIKGDDAMIRVEKAERSEDKLEKAMAKTVSRTSKAANVEKKIVKSKKKK